MNPYYQYTCVVLLVLFPLSFLVYDGAKIVSFIMSRRENGLMTLRQPPKPWNGANSGKCELAKMRVNKVPRIFHPRLL